MADFVFCCCRHRIGMVEFYSFLEFFFFTLFFHYVFIINPLKLIYLGISGFDLRRNLSIVWIAIYTQYKYVYTHGKREHLLQKTLKIILVFQPIKKRIVPTYCYFKNAVTFC